MLTWKKGLLIAAATVSVGLLVVACGAQAPTPTPTREPTATPRPATPTPGGAPTNDLVAKGKALYSAKGCVGCHGPNGQGVPGVGAKLVGIYGGTETLTDGSQVTVDDAYIMESVRNPNAKVVKGFQPMMPAFTLTDSEIKEIIAYIASLK